MAVLGQLQLGTFIVFFLNFHKSLKRHLTSNITQTDIILQTIYFYFRCFYAPISD